MKINIEKRHIYYTVAVLIVLFGIGYAIALSGDNIPWHPLQQISTDATGGISVDANNDQKIDAANAADTATTAGSLTAGDKTIQGALTVTGAASTGPLTVNGDLTVTGTMPSPFSYAGLTTGTWTGSNIGGYDGARDKCRDPTEYPGSHMCTTTGIAIIAQLRPALTLNQGWISGDEWDCNAWSGGGDGLTFTSSSGFVRRSCGNSYPIHCCY